MTECVCDYTPQELQIFIDNYRKGLAANVSMFRSNTGQVFLIIHKGDNCICVYELINGNWELVPRLGGS